MQRSGAGPVEQENDDEPAEYDSCDRDVAFVLAFVSSHGHSCARRGFQCTDQQTQVLLSNWRSPE